MLAALGRGIARHPGRVVAVWAVLAVLGFLLATGVVGDGLFSRLTSGEPTVPGESRTGRQILQDNALYGESLTLLLDRVPLHEPAVATEVARDVGAARADLLAVDGVARVSDPFADPGGPTSPAAAPLLAAEGDGLLVVVDLDRALDGPAQERALTVVQDRLETLGEQVEAAVPGARAQVGGITLLVDAITGQVEVDLRTGEGIALPVSLLVMVFVFGGILAAGVPVLGAVVAIAGALVSLLAFAYVIDLDASVVNVVTVLALGLCIDYGLLLVSRYRDELRGGDSAERALEATLATAGRTVLFSALTVAISLSGLLIFQAQILRAIGAAGVSVVVVAMLVALTLVPALLALSGPRLLRPGVVTRVPLLGRLARRFGDVPPPEGFFSRLARRTQRHPVAVVVAVTSVLLLLAVPALTLALRSSGPELLPADSPERAFYTTLAERYPGAALPPVTVVAETSPARLAGLAGEAQAIEGVATVTPPQRVGQAYAAFSVLTGDGDAGGDAAHAVVDRMRAAEPGYPMWVTGQTATLVDFTAAMRERALLAGGLVVLTTFVLLFLMTGSVLVPAKALAMNLVSLGAAFGVVVWVFQEGHLEGLLGFTSTGGIETTVPLLILAFGFGLAMDYEVFLISRIKEMRDRGMPNNEAVVAGLQASGRIITSAALVVVLVFSGFVAGELLVIKQTGIALAVAVAIDATLVRCLLVPATMTLLGDWNWWAPRPLRRLHQRLGFSHAPAAAPPAQTPANAPG